MGESGLHIVGEAQASSACEVMGVPFAADHHRPILSPKEQECPGPGVAAEMPEGWWRPLWPSLVEE